MKKNRNNELRRIAKEKWKEGESGKMRWMLLRVKNEVKETKKEGEHRDVKEYRKKLYLFIQMSFHVVYKWKHEEVINHKAWNVLCEKGKKGEDEMIKRHLALQFVYTHCHWTIRSLLLASSKRKQRWRKKKSFIWTRNCTWFFTQFQFLIFIPFHGFEYLCNKSEHRKAQASLLLLPFTSSCRRRQRFLICYLANFENPFMLSQYRLQTLIWFPVRNLVINTASKRLQFIVRALNFQLGFSYDFLPRTKQI